MGFRDRPASVYREHDRPYTREEYIDRAPSAGLTFFERGDQDEDFSFHFSLVAEEKGQIRTRALRSARVSTTQFLEKSNVKSFFLKLLVYPHQILRKNPIVMGAGADRVSSGMRKSFGRPTERAARVNSGKRIMLVRVKEESYKQGREALRRAKMKLPIPAKISLDKGEEILSG